MSAAIRVLHLRLREWRALIATMALGALTLLAGIGLLAQSSYLISRSAIVTTTATLALVITGVRVFAVVRASSRYAERYLGHRTAFRVATRLRTEWFARLATRIPGPDIDTRRGDLVARLGPDIETMQEYSLRVLCAPVASAIAIVAASVLLGAFDPLLGAICLIGLAGCGIGLPLVMRWSARTAHLALAEARAARWAELTEWAEFADELRVNGRFDLLQTAAHPQDHAETRVANAHALSAGVSAIAAGGLITVALVLAMHLVTHGQLDGVFLALVPLTMLAAFEAIPPLIDAQEQAVRARAAVTRLRELNAHPQPTRAALAAPRSGALVVSDVTYTYPGRTTPACTDVTFTITPGEIVGLCGRSGSGKSTLVSLLAGFLPLTRGAIMVGDTAITLEASETLPAHFAFVQQHDHLFDTTIRDNLALASPDLADVRMRAALDACALDLDLATPCGPNGTRLSGGERQRVLIARALLADRPFLVLDEATAHLDQTTARRVMDGIRSWLPQPTVLVCSHEAEVLAWVDRIVELDAPLAVTPNDPADTTIVVPEEPAPPTAPTTQPRTSATAAVTPAPGH